MVNDVSPYLTLLKANPEIIFFKEKWNISFVIILGKYAHVYLYVDLSARSKEKIFI